MFELADRLVGIYKTHNCTKSATINPESFLNNCAIANPYQNKVLRRSSFFVSYRTCFIVMALLANTGTV